MGFKRPFDKEELHELPFKHPRQFDDSDKLTQFADTITLSYTHQSPHVSDFINTNGMKNLKLMEEDTDTGAQANSPFSPEYFGFHFPRRMSGPVGDSFSLLLDRFPRKQVPLGPNHQSNIPLLGRHIKMYRFVQNGASDTNDINYEEIMMGTCIIPMPDSDSSANISGNICAGRTDCGCLDRGTFRCVRQHVMEARENLRKSLGHEKFAAGKFWKHLSVVLPSRSKREFVSYYFNVFILQRRAAQSRSSVLEIDSDDDEWHGNQQAYEVEVSEKDEDSSAVESLADQEGLATHEGDCLEDDDDDNGSDDDDDYSRVSDSYSGDDNYSNAAEREDCCVNLLLEGHVSKSFDESRFNAVFEQTNKVSGQAEDLDKMKTDLSNCMEAKVDGSNDLVSHVYLLDTCDVKMWDARYPTAVTKGIDLQPTCNIIEEIFGQDTRDNKTRNE
ncbi:putative C2H2-like zinc finger protein [Hibiscus syriacus]|uniref:C2H2-like zinc finger protein n=1 Tax=Hibiscus syriacus TaxID=106335 RepID=A0A6A3BT33_HIBSY|nr:putative C2H2-like zinc finger protein [Hibiscus syriacus]